MVETTKTAEALETAVSGTGVMQSEHFRLKYNPETGQWEKIKVTEDVVPTFPGIRDVTPDYTPEGKTFKTIPIGAGPDYTPVPPVVTPTPTPPVEPPVETPTEPEVVTPVVTEPEQTRETDTTPTFVTKSKTTVDVGGVSIPSSVIQVSPNYRDKYKNLPGGLNNWSDAQVLEYAIDTGALNSILSQNNNPYYVKPQEKKEGIMADMAGTATLGLQLGAKALDATLGKKGREALVLRLIEGGILEGTVTNYLDDRGNYKTNTDAKLKKIFKNPNSTQNGLVDAEVPLPLISIEFDGEEKEIKPGNVVPVDEELQKQYQEKGTYFNRLIGQEITLEQNEILQERMKAKLDEIDEILAKEVPPYRTSIFPGPVSKNNQRNIILGQQRRAAEARPEIAKAFTSLVNQQAAITMGQAGITGIGVSPRPAPIVPKRKPPPDIVPSYFETARQLDIKDGKIISGIAESQSKMGTSGSHTNNEKVFVDSGGGHYTSDGKYHYDSDGDGRADTVASRGTAGQAQEAANNGFIPAKTLERMTNPDGTLKSLYLQGGNYAIDSKYVKDGKYVGNVVKENRDVVDNGGDGNVIDNSAPQGSNDKQDHEIRKKSEKTGQTGGPAGMGGAPGQQSGGGSKDKKKKIVCTMMNESYGFGSFRNKIWLAYGSKLSKEYEIGYHTLFLPLVSYAKKEGVTNKIIKIILEHIARHRTVDIRKQKYNKIDILGRLYRIILEPLCYITGRIKLWQKK